MDSSGDNRFTRRRFLGLGAAVGASLAGLGSVVGVRIVESLSQDSCRLCWSVSETYPGQRVTLSLSIPKASRSRCTLIEVSVMHEGRECGRESFRLSADQNALEMDIQLPWSELVAGEYRYCARALVGRQQTEIRSEPLLLHVKPFYLWA